MDILTYGLLNKKIEEAKNVSGEKITEAVNDYLNENPPPTGATAEQAAQIDKNESDIGELKGDLVKNHTTHISLTQGSSTYEYTIVSGHEYKITLNGGSANIWTRETQNGANIEVVATGIDAPDTIEFTATQNAKYLFVFTTTNTTLDIYDTDRIGNSVYYIEENMNRHFVVDKNGNGDFIRLRDGIDEAIKYRNSIVYVNEGVYDLLNEFSREINETLTAQTGIKLENDVTVIFSSGAYVKCLYPNNGQRVDLDRYFSAFYSGENGGFTLENLNISVSNIRYCVHDDQPRATKFRRNRYINCIMSMDNTNSPSGDYPECIGGGCSKNLEVVIDGCEFHSKKAETRVYDLVSYHNTNQFTDAMTNIFVKNCYFKDNGTFKCSHYGNSKTVSNAYVCNNSLGAEPIIKYEVTGATTPQNFRLVSWNNEIRAN